MSHDLLSLQLATTCHGTRRASFDALFYASLCLLLSLFASVWVNHDTCLHHSIVAWTSRDGDNFGFVELLMYSGTLTCQRCCSDAYVLSGM